MEDAKILKRSVAQIGERLMIALDKDWCRQHGIKKGDELDVVVVQSGFLVLRPGGEANICPTCHYSYCNCACDKEF
jgi:hypothetical protein